MRNVNARRVRAALVVALLVPLLVAAARQPARAEAPETSSPEQQLAERYAPTVMLRAHDGVCGDTGEPYVPMTVDAVLGNPEVALRQVGNGDPVITWAPT